MLKNKQFYFFTTGQIRNTKVVMFIKFDMYRGVCVCVCVRVYVKTRIFLVKNNREEERSQLVLTYMCMCAGVSDGLVGCLSFMAYQPL